LNDLERLLAVFGGEHPEALLGQVVTHQLGDIGLVFDD
jgi:hypothetical protein